MDRQKRAHTAPGLDLKLSFSALCDFSVFCQQPKTRRHKGKVRASKDERYISKLNNIWIHTDTDYLGEVSGTGNVADKGEIQYYHPPAKWESGYKGAVAHFSRTVRGASW